MGNEFRPFDHKSRCDQCGMMYYRSDCFKTWDHKIVCRKCYDGARNPQDYLVHATPDRENVPNARPWPTPVYAAPLYGLLTETDEYLITEASEYILQ